MTRILKIGDPVYSQSIRKLSSPQLEVFPQREQFLKEHLRGVDFEMFHHSVIQDVSDVWRERSRLLEYLEGRHFDWIMVDNPLSALVTKHGNGTKVLFDCIDWYDEVYLKEYGIDKRYYLLRYGLLDLLESAAKVVAQSPVILDALKTWGLKTADTIVIPNGFDEKLFFPYSQSEIQQLKDRISSRCNVNLEGKDILVFTGKVTAWSGAIRTVADAVDGNQVLLIVGEGELLNQIPSKPSVIRCGAVPPEEVPQFTNIADVLVSPVDSDCSPMAVSEYLALGKPIVMPKGRIDWLLKDGKNACLVDNNVYSWRRGIKQALAEREKFGTRNLTLAKDLTWARLADKFAAFIR